jgi:hypothetical protein
LVSGVSASTTIGQLPFCTPAKDVLAGENFTTLSAALAAAKDVVIGDVPAGKLIVVAPDNDAFAAVLKQLDLTAEELLADTDLLANVLAVHVAIAADDSAESATAISGDKLNFELAGKPATLADVVAAADGLSINGPTNDVEVSKPLTCVGGDQVYFPSSGVLLPTAAPAPGPAPSPKPTPSPMPTPSPKPPSSATMTGFASVVVAGAAAVLLA